MSDECTNASCAERIRDLEERALTDEQLKAKMQAMMEEAGMEKALFAQINGLKDEVAQLTIDKATLQQKLRRLENKVATSAASTSTAVSRPQKINEMFKQIVAPKSSCGHEAIIKELESKNTEEFNHLGVRALNTMVKDLSNLGKALESVQKKYVELYPYFGGRTHDQIMSGIRHKGEKIWKVWSWKKGVFVPKPSHSSKENAGDDLSLAGDSKIGLKEEGEEEKDIDGPTESTDGFTPPTEHTTTGAKGPKAKKEDAGGNAGSTGEKGAKVKKEDAGSNASSTGAKKRRQPIVSSGDSQSPSESKKSRYNFHDGSMSGSSTLGSSRIDSEDDEKKVVGKGQRNHGKDTAVRQSVLAICSDDYRLIKHVYDKVRRRPKDYEDDFKEWLNANHTQVREEEMESCKAYKAREVDKHLDEEDFNKDVAKELKEVKKSDKRLESALENMKKLHRREKKKEEEVKGKPVSTKTDKQTSAGSSKSRGGRGPSAAPSIDVRAFAKGKKN